jgi:hypothetical protein
VTGAGRNITIVASAESSLLVKKGLSSMQKRATAIPKVEFSSSLVSVMFRLFSCQGEMDHSAPFPCIIPTPHHTVKGDAAKVAVIAISTERSSTFWLTLQV